MGVKRKRRRRKNGKPVGNGSAGVRERINDRRKEDQLSNLTLDDLIRVLAYQEFQKNQHRPCKGENMNVCVAEGCFNGEDCLPKAEDEENAHGG